MDTSKSRSAKSRTPSHTSISARSRSKSTPSHKRSSANAPIASELRASSCEHFDATMTQVGELRAMLKTLNQTGRRHPKLVAP